MTLFGIVGLMIDSVDRFFNHLDAILIFLDQRVGEHPLQESLGIFFPIILSQPLAAHPQGVENFAPLHLGVFLQEFGQRREVSLPGIEETY